MQNSSNLTYFEIIIPQLEDIYSIGSFVTTVVFLIPGWFLNFISMSIFLKKIFWTNTSMGYYYSISCLFSNLCVTIGIFNFFPYSFNQNFTLMNLAGCKLMWFFRNIALNTSVWFKAQATVDLAINTVYPKKFTWLRKTKNLIIVTLAMIVILVLIASINLFRFIEIENIDGIMIKKVCTLDDGLLEFFSFTFLISKASSLFLIISANVIIFKKVVISKKKLVHPTVHSTINHSITHTNSIENQSKTSKVSRTSRNKEFSFAFSLMTSNFIRFILTLPFLIVLIVQITVTFAVPSHPDLIVYISLLYGITNFGNYIYEAIEFYLMFSTNKIFKIEILKIILPKRVQSHSIIHDKTQSKI